MARHEFSFQGFTARTQGAVVRELFEIPEIQRVLMTVAFVGESGAKEIETELRAHATKSILLAGIRNDITSRQGLAFLFDLGVRLYAVDTGARSPVFHPKLYLVRGARQARMLIGSANLTLGGLNNNIEAGLRVEFDLSNADDADVVRQVESTITALPAAHPANVIEITATTQLDDMLLQGRLIDETSDLPPRPARRVSGTGAGDAVPKIVLPVPRKRGPLGKVAGAAGRPASPAMPPKRAALPLAVVGVPLELVWQSKPLTRRDLTIPEKKVSKATGSMNLDKGRLPATVDHRHYFRDDVFAGLTWKPAGPTVEQAHADFELVVKGISYGVFTLSIRHTTSTTTTTYLQGNAMTRLSWGAAQDNVRHPDLIGRTLSLYRDAADFRRFVLEID